MQTKIITLTPDNRSAAIVSAAEIIKSGGLVVFPTETVYGLGANVFDEKAVKKIFQAKGRPGDNPIIVHVINRDTLMELVENISPLQEKLMEAFWPGPLTIIFDKKTGVSRTVSGGLGTVAVRMPSHPVARELIRSAGTPIAAPSANISGRPSSTTIEHVFKDLKGKVDMVLDDGFSDIGLESTVVKIDGNKILVLRPGAVTKEALEKISGAKVIFSTEKKDLQASPGTKYRHYAPKAELEIITPGKIMERRARALDKKGKRVGILCTTENKKYFKDFKKIFVLGGRNRPEEISKNLYAGLRYFDSKRVDVILCESFPEKGVGVALMDRLGKASGRY